LLGKSFAEYVVQCAREGSGRSDTIERAVAEVIQ